MLGRRCKIVHRKCSVPSRSASCIAAHYLPPHRREDVQIVLSSRETLFSTVCNNSSIREPMNLSLKDARSIEVEALLSSCHISRKHSSLQGSLATATYLSDLSEVCSRVGLDIQAAAQNEVADALWDQGEYSTSISMLRRLARMPAAQLQDTTGSTHRATLLAKLVGLQSR